MSVKCAIFENNPNKDKPEYKELDNYLGKKSKVLYGGGKRKSKTVPYIDKLHLVESAFNTFEKTSFGNHSYTRELYLFDSEANATALTLKFADNLLTHFVIDDGLIDDLYHLSWSHSHLISYKRSLQNDVNKLNFFDEKNIGNKKFFKEFPNYTKSVNKFIITIDDAISEIESKASIILKSGW